MEKSELAEVEQNVKREQNRRKGKRKERLEPEEIPEGRKRQDGDEEEERDREQEEEMHWRNLMLHMNKIQGNQKWISVRQMEKSNLEEQRLLAYGDVEPRDECGADQRNIEECYEDATQPGGASIGPRGAVVCGREGGCRIQG